MSGRITILNRTSKRHKPDKDTLVSDQSVLSVLESILETVRGTRNIIAEWTGKDGMIDDNE